MLDFAVTLSATVNQTDRIQGMARWMNNEGSSFQLVPLLFFILFILTVVILLRYVAARGRRRRMAEAARKLAASAAQPTNPRAKKSGRRPLK